MTASKTLTSAITAATILGVLSFVYAQTEDSAAVSSTQTSRVASQAPSPAPDLSSALQPSAPPLSRN